MAFESILRKKPIKEDKKEVDRTTGRGRDGRLLTARLYNTAVDRSRPFVHFQLVIVIGNELMKMVGFSIGQRIDVLIDKNDRFGLIRPDPNGLKICYRGDTKTAEESKRSGVVRISRTNWRFNGTIILPNEEMAKEGELMFEVPRKVEFIELPPVDGRGRDIHPAAPAAETAASAAKTSKMIFQFVKVGN